MNKYIKIFKIIMIIKRLWLNIVVIVRLGVLNDLGVEVGVMVKIVMGSMGL